MKVWTRVLSLIAVMAVLMAMLGACGKENAGTSNAGSTQQTKSDGPDYLNATGMPIVNKPITVKMLAGIGPYNKGEFSDVEIWKVYEKMTGIHVEWEAIPSASLNERKNIVLASGNLPDAFFKVIFTTDELTRYGGQGMLLPINKYMDKYTPEFKKVLTDYPDVKDAITMMDKNIYSFPYVVTAVPSLFGNKMFVNQKWLDNVGMKAPTTTEEFYQVLKAFRDKDPNQNGKPDEIPLTSPQQIGSIIDPLKGAWGLGNRGLNHPYVDADPTTGKLRFIPTDPKYKELLQFINKLYNENLLDQEIFTMTLPNLAAKGAQNMVGFSFATNVSYVGKEQQDNFKGIPVALKGPGGEQLYANYKSSLASVGTMTISAATKYPEAILRWADYFYGDSGRELFFMGIEGKTYTKTSDGKLKYTDEVNNNPKGLTKEEVLGQYVVWSGGGNPSVADDKHFGDHAIDPITREAGNNMLKFAPKTIWASFSYSKEDSDQIKALETDILTYVTDMQAKFITGNIGFDKWDEYVSTIKKMGLDNYLKLYEKGVPKN